MKYLKNFKVEYYAFTLSLVLSFLVTFCLTGFLNIFLNDISTALTIFTFSLLINHFVIFNCLSEWFFHLPIIKEQIPNFSGKWSGEGRSTYKEEALIRKMLKTKNLK